MDFDISKYIGPATFPPVILFLLYVLRQHWPDIRAAIGRLYSDKNEDWKDRREAEQSLVEKQQQYQFERGIWREDKLAEVLEMDSSFIREVVHKELAAINPTLTELKNQVKQQREMLRELAGVIADLTKEIKRDE